MRLIFSRKGFDSSAGGVPSPIIGGRPHSLPIPTRMPTVTRFRDLGNGTAALVDDLTNGKLSSDQPCHLDPDLDAGALSRPPGWRGALGQVSAAQSHLENHGVGSGDVFLFWGLFRPAVRTSTGRWTYSGPREHRIFGWLQVDEVLSVGSNPTPNLERHPWLATHPHLVGQWPANNTVYVARERLSLPGIETDLPGWGLLSRGHRLTAAASPQPSTWAVPDWLHPDHGGTGLTYHRAPSWRDATTLQTAARGQEFIADVGQRRDALTWLRQLLQDAG